MLLTLTEIILFFKENDLIIDDCDDLMLCFQSYLGLGVSGICIQRHIVRNIIYSTFTNVFKNSCHVSLRF